MSRMIFGLLVVCAIAWACSSIQESECSNCVFDKGATIIAKQGD